MPLFDHIQIWSKIIHDVTVSMFSFGFSFVLFFNTWAAASLFPHQKTLISLEETCEIEFSGVF